jgi:hypothetical protein
LLWHAANTRAFCEPPYCLHCNYGWSTGLFIGYYVIITCFAITLLISIAEILLLNLCLQHLLWGIFRRYFDLHTHLPGMTSLFMFIFTAGDLAVQLAVWIPWLGQSLFGCQLLYRPSCYICQRCVCELIEVFVLFFSSELLCEYFDREVLVGNFLRNE